MNNRQIEAFRATAQAGTVTAAAEALHITQPAVSRLLADLERRLELTLFDRVHGRLRLTPEGQAFLREVDRHFIGMEQLRAAARRISAHGPGSLRVLAVPSAASGALPRVLADLLVEHPDTAMTLDTDTTDRIAARVVANGYDVGFAMNPVPQSVAVESRAIASRPWVCVFPPEHRFSNRSRIRLRDLADEPLIGFSAGMSLRERVDRAFQAQGIAPDFALSAQTIESICCLVAAGCAGAIIHPYTSHIVAAHGLKAVLLDEPLSVDLVAVTPPGAPPSVLTEELIARAQRAYADGY